MIDVEDQPDSISIDTSIFAHAIVAGSLFHNVANAYCDALIAAATPIYYSELVRVELPQALRKFANDPQAWQFGWADVTLARVKSWGFNAPCMSEARAQGLCIAVTRI